jgi:riboflavin biosynthesis pyrimidine reductase
MDSRADDENLIARYATDRDRPVLRMNFVSSADGAVEVAGYSEGLQTPPDNRLFGILRMLADAVLVGAGTLRHEAYKALTLDAKRRDWRAAHGLAPYPRLVIVSRSLDLDPASAVFAGAPVRPVVVTHGAADDERRDALDDVADVLVHGVDRVDLRAALAELRETYELRHILCEGGPHLFGSLLAADIVDELCLTLAPILAGPGAGRIIGGPPSAPAKFRLLSAIQADDTLLLRYARP